MDDAPDPTRAGPPHHSPALHEAIEAIYASVTDPAAAEALPTRLASLLGAGCVGLWCMDTDLSPVDLRVHGLDPADVVEYGKTWLPQDQLIAATLDSFLGKTATPDRVLGPRAFKQCSVYEGFYHRHDMVRAMGRFERIGAEWVSGVTLMRGAREPDPNNVDQRMLEICVHHFRRACRLRIEMGLLEARARSAESLLADCRLATWLVDERARIHSTNATAEALQARPESGLCTAHARLRFVDEPLNSALQNAIAKLAEGGRRPIELPFGNRPRGAIAWGLVTGLDDALQPAGATAPLYLVTLAQRGATCQPAPARLRARLPVSRVESEVLAALMCGSEPPSIAKDRGSTLETIRGYEKSLRTRLRCNSRAQLVARGWRALAVLPTLDATQG